MYIYMIYIYLYIHIYIYMYLYIYTYTYMCLYIHTYTYTYMYIYIYTNVCTCICIHMCTYIYIYTHIWYDVYMYMNTYDIHMCVFSNFSSVSDRHGVATAGGPHGVDRERWPRLAEAHRRRGGRAGGKIPIAGWFRENPNLKWWLGVSIENLEVSIAMGIPKHSWMAFVREKIHLEMDDDWG